MLKHFTEETGQVYWLVISWFRFFSFFENREYIGFFPAGWGTKLAELRIRLAQ